MAKRYGSTVWVGLSVLAAMAGAGAFVSADAKGSAPNSVAARPAERDLAPAALRYYWTRELNLAGTERIVRAWLKDENLYFATNTRCLWAVDAAVGNPRWFVNTGENPVFEPVSVSNMQLSERIGGVGEIAGPNTLEGFDTFPAVVVNSMTHLMVLDRRTGRIYRDVPLEHLTAAEGGACDGTTFYVGTTERGYCAIRLFPNVVVWRQHLGQNVSIPVVYHEQKIFLGTLDGLLRCAMTENLGEKRWERTFDGSITEKPLVDARGLFLACNDHRIYAFHPDSGKPLWPAVVVKGDVGGPMQMGEKTLFQHIRGEGLYAVDVTHGRVRWILPNGRRVLAILDGVVYVLDAEKNLRLVNEITGKNDITVPLDGFDFYLDNTAAPAIYAATRDGQVFCLRPAQAGRLTAEMLTTK